MADEKAKQLRLKDITAEDGINPRAKGLDEGHVADLMDAIERGEELPPLVVYRSSGGTLWLSEGFHRAEAYRRKKVERVPCIVRKGERADALANACGSNSGHGLKRTNADKRHAVELLLKEFPKWSNPRVAEQAAVSAEFVRKMRPAEEGETREGADGRSQSASKGSSNADNSQVATVATCGEEKPEENAVSTSEGAEEEPADPADDAQEESASPPLPPAPPSATVVPPTPVDAWGIPIQPHAAEAFDAVPKFKELVSAIQQAQRLFNEVANLPGGTFLRVAEVSSFRRGKKTGEGEYEDRYVHTGLETALAQVKGATPKHTVCPYQYAERPHPEKCPCCLGQLWTPEVSKNVPPACIDRAKAAFGVGGDKEAA